MNAETSDYELQREVIERFGERYPDMTVNDWRHIIEAYSPMIKDASRPKAKEVSMLPEQMPMAAEDA
jgi:type I restriction enzyme R subunit